MEKINVEIKANYRGYKFNFSECSNEWSVKIGEENEACSNPDIKKVKEYVDKLIKNEFKPMKIFLRNPWRNSEIEEATITSIDSQEKDEVWVVKSGGGRSKENKNICFAFTEDNLTKINQLKEIEKKIGELNKEDGRIYKSLVKAL